MRMTIRQETRDNLLNIHKHEGGRKIKGEKREGGALCTEAEIRLDCSLIFIIYLFTVSVYIAYTYLLCGDGLCTCGRRNTNCRIGSLCPS